MKFIGLVERESTVTIDGYSDRKTLKAAIRDMGRWIAENINEDEGKSLIEYQDEVMLSAENSYGGYFLEAEEVGCASRWNDETNEMEYSSANWYIACRICK